MLQQSILELDLFDVLEIDFIGSFPQSCGHIYILLVMDYVSKWVEAISYAKNDAITKATLGRVLGEMHWVTHSRHTNSTTLGVNLEVEKPHSLTSSRRNIGNGFPDTFRVLTGNSSNC
ncbi:putative mitochondrial protein [Cucumis melo var. makuwa]|uniref:Mitochondrial protein n=1 Tax=Cucumis melo var. makuwa TaxID=1194695 RepID=A0A5A7U276_CUCMM|nr:putative mitochondrial protein [Cucumis melo var. makuwa]TYK02389.1 putative mitochondrial protein [Cucumis melo var. makuwa]